MNVMSEPGLGGASQGSTARQPRALPTAMWDAQARNIAIILKKYDDNSLM
jgi:hypothetical protein